MKLFASIFVFIFVLSIAYTFIYIEDRFWEKNYSDVGSVENLKNSYRQLADLYESDIRRGYKKEFETDWAYTSVNRANLRASDTTGAAVITTLERGEKMFLIGEIGEWSYVVPVLSAKPGWVHSDLITTGQGPLVIPGDLEIVEIDYQILNAFSSYYEYTWELTLKNNSAERKMVDAKINFYDSDGTVVETEYSYDLILEARSVNTFKDDVRIPNPDGRDVSRVYVSVN